MEVQVYFIPTEVPEDELRARTAVVIDVLRASTSIITAIAHGARGVIPADTLESATEMVTRLGMDDVLLCAERDMQRVEGCDLGNSPAEYTPDVVGGRLLVLSTTNGTRAINRASAAARVLIGSYVNAASIVEELADQEKAVLICAGNSGGFALEDAACAGFILQRLAHITGREMIPVNDGAWVALQLGRRTPRNPLRMLRRSAHGQRLDGAGFSTDLHLCAAVDSLPIVPRVRDRIVTGESLDLPG
jgi:2-phosphosulfolactate phosphatase